MLKTGARLQDLRYGRDKGALAFLGFCCGREKSIPGTRGACLFLRPDLRRGGGGGEKVVMKASTNSKQFRMVFSHKWNDDTKTPLMPRQEYSNNQCTIEHFMVQEPEITEDSVVLTGSYQLKQADRKRKRKRASSPAKNEETKSRPLLDMSSDPVWKELHKQFPDCKIDKQCDAKYYIYNAKTGNSCHMCGRVHENNNQIASVHDNENVWLYNFSTHCPHKSLLFNVNTMIHE